MNLSNIFQNHDTDYNVAHIECQDSYYIDKYNAKADNKLKVVALRDSAELVHMSFYGYNDLQVYDGNTQVVNIDGHVFGKSDVKKCEPNFAAGYYSYVTEEKMELFFPVNKEYKVSFKSYSKKIYHTLNYKTVCLYSGASSKKQNLPSGSDWAWFNSDRVTKMIIVKP
jgi:hypothetical protein